MNSWGTNRVSSDQAVGPVALVSARLELEYQGGTDVRTLVMDSFHDRQGTRRHTSTKTPPKTLLALLVCVSPRTFTRLFIALKIGEGTPVSPYLVQTGCEKGFEQLENV